MGEAFVGAAGIDEDEAEVIARVEVGGGEGDGAAVGIDGGGGVAGALAGEAELVPGFGGFRIEGGGGGEVR